MSPEARHAHRWAAFGASARGSAHARGDVPNEDAVAWQSDDDGRWAVVAVADGHGHSLAVRADVGARLAADIAVDAARSCCEGLSGEGDGSAGSATADRLQAAVLDGWLAAVEADLASRPLSDAELERSGDRQAIATHPGLAYGTTLLLSLAVGGSIVSCQVGDGDVVAIKRDGRTTRPLPPDNRLVGTRTTSLASRSARADFRSSHVVVDDESIEAVVAATDGYVNSFSADDGFATAGQDLWKLLHEIGPAAVENALAGWLESTSSDGTGDDATLAILYDRAHLAHGAGVLSSADVVTERGGM